MSLQIDVAGSIGCEVTLALRTLVAESLAHLEADSLSKSPATAIHDARINFKAVRSVLRLARPALGSEFAVVNVALRDASRALSRVRDTQALVDAMDVLDRRFGPLRDRTDLRAALASVSHSDATPAAVAAAAAAASHLARQGLVAIDRWRLPDADIDPYVAGLRTTYRDARGMLRRGLSTGLAGDLHEARKRVIHWRYQIDVLRGLWPRPMRALARELQDLRQTLGQHNDLVLLQDVIEAQTAAAGAEERWLDEIVVTRAALVRRAGIQGERLFAEPARRHVDRLAHWWRIARADPG